MVAGGSSISIALTSPHSVQIKVCNAGRAPSAGVARTNVIRPPQISHSCSPTSSEFSDMALPNRDLLRAVGYFQNSSALATTAASMAPAVMAKPAFKNKRCIASPLASNSAEIRLNLALISTTQSCADFIAKLGRDWPNWVRKATGEAA